MNQDPIEYAVLRAARFAAEKHRLQRRKDADASPYINHPIAVAETLAWAGVSHRTALLATILHDVIEDTETTPEEIERLFGAEVCSVVKEVSADKALPKAVRKQLQVERTPHKSERARLVKLADLIANGADVVVNLASWTLAAEWTLDRLRVGGDPVASAGVPLQRTTPGGGAPHEWHDPLKVAIQRQGCMWGRCAPTAFSCDGGGPK